MATLVNKMNREVKVIIPNMREFRVFYSDNEGSVMFFKRDWVEETTKKEEPVSEDLEEAADNHIRKVVDAAGHPGWEWETQDIINAFIAGAEWQNEQMMKDAVDYKIVNNLAAYPVIYYEVKHLGLKYGDKVKIIIIKEDE